MHAAGKVFKIDLVHDAEPRRHDAEGVKCLHAPFHELVALLVAPEFELHVQVERTLCAEIVDHDRMINHEVDRHQRFDALGIQAPLRGDIAHCSQIREQRDAGEVLQDDACDNERDFLVALAFRLPSGQLTHVLLSDFLAIAMAQHGFEHDSDGKRQAFDIDAHRLAERRQRVEMPHLAGDLE